MMNEMTQTTKSVPGIRIAGGIAILCGIIGSIGIVTLIGMYACFATQNMELGYKIGMVNDISAAIQYLLTIPIALVLYKILQVYNLELMRTATIVGIFAMLLVVGLQLLLIFRVLTFEQQVLWLSLAMILGVGSWLVITGLAAHSTGRLPNILLISILAVPYFGYPVWAFRLGQRLLSW